MLVADDASYAISPFESCDKGLEPDVSCDTGDLRIDQIVLEILD
jgi:hypothetical protein